MDSIWHSIDNNRIAPEEFIAVVEIEKGSKKKYEIDKETGYLRLDRILYTSTHYPANYGFIPKTYASDEDPLDVLILASEPIIPMCLVKCYPIGVIGMEDSGANDEKIIAIPFGDPAYNSYDTIDDLPAHIFDEMLHFFAVYKNLEVGKKTEIKELAGPERAKEIISSCIERYHAKFEE